MLSDFRTANNVRGTKPVPQNVRNAAVEWLYFSVNYYQQTTQPHSVALPHLHNYSYYVYKQKTNKPKPINCLQYFPQTLIVSGCQPSGIIFTGQSPSFERCPLIYPNSYLLYMAFQNTMLLEHFLSSHIDLYQMLLFLHGNHWFYTNLNFESFYSC